MEEKAARKVAMQDSSSLLGDQSMDDSINRRDLAKKIHIIELDGGGAKENEGGSLNIGQKNTAEF